MEQNCKHRKVDPFFARTGSKVGLAWQVNDSTKTIRTAHLVKCRIGDLRAEYKEQ